MADDLCCGEQIISPFGEVEQADKNTLQLLGYKHEDYIGTNFKLYHCTAQTISTALRSLNAGIQALDYQDGIYLGNGTTIQCRISLGAYWEKGTLVHIRCFIRPSNLSPQQDMEQVYGKLIQAHNERDLLLSSLSKLQDLATTKSEFLAYMAHELRNPLHGIVCAADLLGSCLESQPAESPSRVSEFPSTTFNSMASLPSSVRASSMQKYVSAIVACGKAMQTIVNDVLDVSKLEAGKVACEHIPVDVVDLLQQVIVLGSTTTEKKGINLELESSQIPIILSDPTRLRQIVCNLVTNGIKFTEHGTVTVNLNLLAAEDFKDSEELSALLPHGSSENSQTLRVLQISVKDTGKGISPAILPTLFQPYHQATLSVAREHGGTGLGLYIAKSLTELLGGIISAQSQENVGSQFTVTLPVELAENPIPSSFPVSNQVSSSTSCCFSGVDDNAQSIRPSTSSSSLPPCNFDLLSPADYDFDSASSSILSSPSSTPVVNIEPQSTTPLVNQILVQQQQLPVEKAEGARTVEPSKNSVANSPPLKNLRCLVVDDSPLARKLFKCQLQALGASVETASSGAEALALFGHPDYSPLSSSSSSSAEGQEWGAVFMDLGMSGMSGWEAVRLLRQTPQGRDLPVVALSGTLPHHILSSEAYRTEINNVYFLPQHRQSPSPSCCTSGCRCNVENTPPSTFDAAVEREELSSSGDRSNPRQECNCCCCVEGSEGCVNNKNNTRSGDARSRGVCGCKLENCKARIVKSNSSDNLFAVSSAIVMEMEQELPLPTGQSDSALSLAGDNLGEEEKQEPQSEDVQEEVVVIRDGVLKSKRSPSSRRRRRSRRKSKSIGSLEYSSSSEENNYDELFESLAASNSLSNCEATPTSSSSSSSCCSSSASLTCCSPSTSPVCSSRCSRTPSPVQRAISLSSYSSPSFLNFSLAATTETPQKNWDHPSNMRKKLSSFASISLEGSPTSTGNEDHQNPEGGSEGPTSRNFSEMTGRNRGKRLGVPGAAQKGETPWFKDCLCKFNFPRFLTWNSNLSTSSTTSFPSSSSSSCCCCSPKSTSSSSSSSLSSSSRCNRLCCNKLRRASTISADFRFDQTQKAEGEEQAGRQCPQKEEPYVSSGISAFALKPLSKEPLLQLLSALLPPKSSPEEQATTTTVSATLTESGSSSSSSSSSSTSSSSSSVGDSSDCSDSGSLLTPEGQDHPEFVLRSRALSPSISPRPLFSSPRGPNIDQDNNNNSSSKDKESESDREGGVCKSKTAQSCSPLAVASDSSVVSRRACCKTLTRP